MAIKKIKLPGMTQPIDIGTTWANVSGKPDLMTSSEINAAIDTAFATSTNFDINEDGYLILTIE